MKFNRAEFWRFCAALQFDSKEMGLMRMDKPLGTQRFLIDQIADGLEQGIHHFVVLKGRQDGITTICLALDLYWHFKTQGLTGTLVLHEESARDMFRTTLQMYYDSLPDSWKQRLAQHNRNQMVFGNKSRLMYQISGSRGKGKLGRGRAIIFMHSTETSSYTDEEGMDSLISSLAEKNPNRLFIFESTARGYNMFNDIWETAKGATTQKAIFVPWWKNDLRRYEKGSKEYAVYWENYGRVEAHEREWIRDVKRLYGYEMQPEQIVWWRWMLHERVADIDRLFQEYPPTENYAFQMTGSQFFNNGRLTEAIHDARGRKPTYYRMNFGSRFEETSLTPCGKEGANLTVWSDPMTKPVPQTVQYVIGADPAYGSSDWADQFCIQVFRVWGDGMEQVAEFCTTTITTAQFAWAICYLAGVYDNVNLNLEVTGPGKAVLSELENLRKSAMLAPSVGKGRGMYDVVGNMQYYIYQRLDSTRPNGSFYGWQTNADSKERMLNAMRDTFMRGALKIYSEPLVAEMKKIVRDGGFIGADGRNKDDRVIACALACVSWAERLRLRLSQMKLTRITALAAEKAGAAANPPQERLIQGYLQRIGVA